MVEFHPLCSIKLNSMGNRSLGKKRFLFMLTACLFLLFTGCGEPDIGVKVKPFADISLTSVKKIQFIKTTLLGGGLGYGNLKTVMELKDMQKIVDYLTTISCAESNEKEVKPYFEFAFVENTEKVNYLYSIGISENQIFMYKYKDQNSTEFVYKYNDTKILEDIKKLYIEMNYSEVQLNNS